MSGDEPKNFIEINGNKYDADTGRLIKSGVANSNKKPSAHSGTIDSVARKPGAIYKPAIIEKSTSEKTPKPIKQANHVARKPSKSSILMRPAVKKPVHKTPESAKAIAKKPAVNPGIPQERIKRAEETKKSPKISRFVPAHSKSTVVKKSHPLPVAQKKHVEHTKPKEDLATQFERAIENASSHLEEFVGSNKDTKKRKKFALVTISLSVLLASGVLLYSTVPMAKIRVAGTKAGFSASLPNYSPAGFGLDGSVKATSGEVSLNYKSRTDNKGYKITQTPSDWNSQSLVSNFLLPAGKEFQTYESGGTTIYVYDGSNATWVNGGIWYVLEGDASLTSDQLLRIANGL